MAKERTERVLVPLAAGFEEIEAIAIVDVLRRAGLEVTVAGLEPGPVEGAHGIEVAPDAALSELDLDAYTTIVLPGGMPGTRRLAEDERVIGLVQRLHAAGRRTAAICAAPLVLARAGVIDGVPVTSHPSVRKELGAARVQDAPRVVRSGNVITSQGPGTAIEFALALVEEICGAAKAAELSRAMVVARG
jgi:4-methyl-5(b-hydroxyethyl)-thiazole monophosphate biosynthesis